MLELFLYSATAFFVVLDPVGTAAIFAAMTHAFAAPRKRRTALRAVGLAAAILALFALLGEALLAGLGISLAALRLAGGALLFLLAADMVFARPSGLRSMTADEDAEASHRHDLSVFPLAFPLIAGPGAMTTSVLLMTRAGPDALRIGLVLGVMAAMLAVTLILLLQAERIARLLGVTGCNVISRVLGIILAALAAQFMLDGLKVALS